METGPPARPLRSGLMHDAITDVPGIEVGHDTDADAVTGCTAVVCRAGAVAGVAVRGAAPGTRETDLCRPGTLVERAHAVVLCGGSAFGLEAASGVARNLAGEGIGYDAGGIRVPIVPAAVIFDLAIGEVAWPDVEAGRRAAAAASGDPPAQGCAGAGTGATVGKVLGMARATKSGIGTASADAGSAVVGAIVVVNAGGDVVDPAGGGIVAGTRRPDGDGYADSVALVRRGFDPPPPVRADDARRRRDRRAAHRRAGQPPRLRRPRRPRPDDPPRPHDARRRHDLRARDRRARRRAALPRRGDAPRRLRRRRRRARDARRGPARDPARRAPRGGRMSAATVRPATPDDETALAALDQLTWSWRSSPAPAPPPGTPFFGERTQPEDVLVAAAGGAVAATSGSARRRPSRRTRHVLAITGLAVDPGRRGEGIGRALVDAAAREAAARGARRLTLRVLGPNATARGALRGAPGSSSRASCARSSTSTAATSTTSSWPATSPPSGGAR